jgi:CRP-like cAMP-binding protein
VFSNTTPVGNQLLAALPPAALASVVPKLASVPLELRKELYRPDGPIEFVWFPQTDMISLVAHLDDGMQAEVGVLGKEGMLGVPLLSGVDTSFNEAMVQMPGSALRMSATDFRVEVEANAPFRTVLQRYSEAHQAQVMQTAACNGRHGLEQRLARWLLMASDRAEGANLPLTQDFMAMMLGVHRPSITVTAGILQRAGLIKYGNGLVTVLDRDALEATSCECYAAVRRRFARLLGTIGS